jgi:hypothetical protein
MRRHALPIVCVLGLYASLLSSPARADVWSGGFDTDWFLSLNWDNAARPPGATETATFPQIHIAVGIEVPLPRTDVSLNSSTTINRLEVNSPIGAQYTLTGSNGAVLTAPEQMDFRNGDLQSLNVHTFSSLGLNTPRVQLFDNAILSLDSSTVTTDLVVFANNGGVDVDNGSSVQTLRYAFNDDAGELRVNSGGELRIAEDTTLLRGTTMINSGGQLNAAAGVDLEYNGSALLQFSNGHAVDNLVHLKATGGGDITGASFIDVGNGNVGTLTVTGSGSTLTAGGSTSDWGLGASGNATVTISSSAVATADHLRAGANNARFVGTVTSGATLHTTSSFTMGGGSTNRTVSLDVNGGTLQTDGLATFNEKASLNLTSGTINFNGGATFNAGSVTIWGGGNMNLGPNSTLLIDATDVVKTSSAGFRYHDNMTIQLRNGGHFQTASAHERAS